MEATKLHKQLEKDFITFEMSDEWFQYMDSVKDFVCDNFKERETLHKTVSDSTIKLIKF